MWYDSPMDFIKRRLHRVEQENVHYDIESSPGSSFSSRQNVAMDEKKIITLLKDKSLKICEIKKILESDSSCINSKDKYGNSVLHLVIDKMDNADEEHIQFFQFLLEKGADPAIKTTGEYSPFLWAARKNKFKAIELLVDMPGNNVNDRTENGDTAIHLAIERDHVETVAILHQLVETHGFNENVESKSSRMTPKQLARSKTPSNEKICAILDGKLDDFYAKNFGYGHKKKDSCYKMSGNPRGICLIFQNDTFDNPEMNRSGCHDAELLETSFRRLKFIVKKELNLTALQMFDKIKEYSMVDHDRYDCFVLCISSHGTADFIFGTDSKTIPVKNVTMPFAGPSCESLRGKPKLFFISACRNEAASAEELSEEEESHDDSDFIPLAVSKTTVKYCSSFEDTFEGYSSPYGFKSYRDVQTGDSCVSLYIDVLCKVLDEYANTQEFQQIMLKVNQGVRHRNAHVPSPINRLLKELWFKAQ